MPTFCSVRDEKRCKQDSNPQSSAHLWQSLPLSYGTGPRCGDIIQVIMPAVAERLRRAYPAPMGRAGVGSIPANPDARNVPSFRRWRFEMKLSPFFIKVYIQCYCNTPCLSTWCLMTNRRRRSSCATTPGHDVPCPSPDLDLPVEPRCAALQGLERAMCRRTEALFRKRQ